jgi:YfiH family protein
MFCGVFNMLLHSNPLFSIYFGDAQDQLTPDYFRNLPDEPLLQLEPFSHLKKTMHIYQLYFIHQVHGIQGAMIDTTSIAQKTLKEDGDFLLTNVPKIGIGVKTADCLPIVFHDKVNGAIAIAHAGWKGTVAGIAVKTVEQMQEAYSTKAENLAIFFGPSAKPCCYQVDKNFKQNLEDFADPDKVLFERGDGHFYFDLPLLNRIQLEAIGVKKEAFHLEYNMCTICTLSFCSFRRDAERSCRQMTVVNLT